MNNAGSPFDKICITHMHHFFYKLDLLMPIKMFIVIMPEYGIHDHDISLVPLLVM